MPDCGSQVVLCDVPIRFDTYKGCSHGCKYCFVKRKKDLREIQKDETEISLKNFIEGKRNQVTNWCDWNIPLHWGGMSDPFQPVEKEYKNSLRCLEVFAKTQYPFIVSTKGKLILDNEYLLLIRKCNCVVQISMVCSEYDKLETGAPTYDERVEMIKVIAKNAKRVIVRIQPYMTQVFNSVKNNMKRVAEAGAYGVIVEGMKFAKRKPGLIKIGADFVYDKKILQEHFEQLKEEAHRYNLKFYVGENRLRTLGDEMCCCGIENLDGFIPNTYNLCHILNNKEYKVTSKMKEPDTAVCFKAMEQTTLGGKKLIGKSFENQMKDVYKEKPSVYNKILGKDS